MGLLSKVLIGVVGLPLAGMLHGTAANAAALGVPANLVADAGTGTLALRWSPVEGAGLYRVAVFDAPEKDGKRPLLAAVWVKGTQYLYGQTATVPKAGKFPSTKPLPLPAGHRLRAMVAAASATGGDKGEWAGIDVETTAKAAAVTDIPTAAITPVPTPTATPAASEEAELEVQGGEEFKQSPDAAVLEIDESAPEAGAGESSAPGAGAAALAAASTGAAAVTEIAKPAAVLGSTPAGEAKALLNAGHFEQAETAYRALLEKDPADADAWEGLGDSFAGRRMKIEAMESYEKALELNKSKKHLRSWIEKNVRR